MEAARRSCLFFLERLGIEIERMREEPFPGLHTGPTKLLAFILGVVDTAKNCLQEAAKPSKSPDEVRVLISTAEWLGGESYKWLTSVAGADSLSIPYQVVAPFKRWVDDLGIRNDLFFRAEHLSNYEIGNINLSPLLKRLSKPSLSLIRANDAITWPIQQVTVPSQSMAMLPHFAAVAHELGHSIQDTIRPNNDRFKKESESFFARVKKRLDEENAAFGELESVKCREIADNWTSEFIADAVGLCLTGPAFFFALSSFLELISNSYGIGESHPPSDLRLNQILRALQTGAPESFASVFENSTGSSIELSLTCPNLLICPSKEKLYSELRGSKLRVRYDALFAAVFTELGDYFEAVAPVIFEEAAIYIKSLGKELYYTPQQYKLDLDRHLELLVALVPPIEYYDGEKTIAASLAAVLNVGWVALLSRLDHMPDIKGAPNQLTAKMERLHELLLKGVELSEARRLWDENK